MGVRWGYDWVEMGWRCDLAMGMRWGCAMCRNGRGGEGWGCMRTKVIILITRYESAHCRPQAAGCRLNITGHIAVSNQTMNYPN